MTNNWEEIFENKVSQTEITPDFSKDPAHDLLHIKRVVTMAKKLALAEGANLEIIIPSAWFHDFVIVPKDSKLRSQASNLSAKAAIEFLKSIDYPSIYFPQIFHAIEGHSFSANIEVTTIEAKVVQDADRLDGIGAIGIARCFATAGLLRRAFYSEKDPFCTQREPEDKSYTLDHFYQKLFKTANSLKTVSGRAEGELRLAEMNRFLNSMQKELQCP